MQYKTLSGSLLLCCVLAACQNIRVEKNSTVALPAAFDHAQTTQSKQDLTQWWQHWQDPVLNQLIEQGLHGNFDIRIAQSRLAESRAAARLALADLGPQAGISAHAAYQKTRLDNPLDDTTRNILGQTTHSGSLTRKSLSGDGAMSGVGVAASWEPDIFGQKRSDADAAKAGAMSAQEQVYGAQILLAADIAQAYLQARALEKNIAQTDKRLSVLSEMVRYVEGRFRAGQVSAYQVDEAKAGLLAMQGKRSHLDAQRTIHVRQIALLTGQTPQGFRLPESPIDVLANQPAAPQGETPAELLTRRPDIRARAAAVDARAAQVASAKAEWYPRFKINFLGQNGRIEIGSNTALNGWANLLSAGISVPIFSSGRLQVNLDAADARLKTALLEYDQTLLRALGEVDNAYQMQHALTQQNQQLQHSAAIAAKQAADAQKLFAYGSKTLDEALRARLNAENAAEQLTQSQLARAQALIGLYQALGGGWAI